MKKSEFHAKILSKAMRYCAYQERCIHDLELKNKEWKLPTNEFEELIHELKEDNFLNEERFAESFVRGKFRLKKWGKLKIKHALYSKNIDNSIIEAKLKMITDKEYSKTIEELLKAKLEQLKGDPDKIIKAQRYLFSKGFEFEDVIQISKQ